MTPAELEAAGRLGGHALSGLVSRIEQVHGAVASRAFGAVGPAGWPARVLHDATASAIYGAVRAAGAAAGTAGGRMASSLGAASRPAVSGRLGDLAVAALNAVSGDRLGSDLAPLTIDMAVRGDDAFTDATSGLVVFVHGLAETENSWRRRDDEFEPYGDRLRAEYGYTPVYVRYNTGRHISENGHDLAVQLGDLVAGWPEPVDSILLIGHSMGGLVIRSACHEAVQGGQAWADRVRLVIYLGAPHLGAPLARAAGLAGAALSWWPETRPFADLVSGSSGGIKDLRYGYVDAADWAGCASDGCIRDHRHDVPLLAGAEHYTVSVTVTADPADPVGAVVGDLLVQPASAHGRQRGRQRIPFRAGSATGLGGLHHFDLLNHPAVWQAIRGVVDSVAGPVAAEPLVRGHPFVGDDSRAE